MSVRGMLSNILLRTPITTRAASGPGQFAGSTQLASNAATVTISTTAVRSDSLIFVQNQALTNQSSGVAAPLEVKTIVDGSYFIVGNADGIAIANRATNIFWMIVQTGRR